MAQEWRYTDVIGKPALNMYAQGGWECYEVTNHVTLLRWLIIGLFLPPQKMYHLRMTVFTEEE